MACVAATITKTKATFLSLSLFLLCAMPASTLAGSAPISMSKHDASDQDGGVLHMLSITAGHGPLVLNGISVNHGTCGEFSTDGALDARDLNLAFPYPMQAKEVIKWAANCDVTDVVVTTDSEAFEFSFEK